MNKKAFYTLSLVIFTSAMGNNIIAPFIAVYATTMGANAFWLGVMFSGVSLTSAVLAPVSGWLCDHHSRKLLMIIGLVLFTLLSLSYILATNFYTLTLVRILMGVSGVLVMPVAQTYVSELTPKGKEATYMNIFMMFLYLGMGFGPFLGGTLNDLYGMNSAFYSMAALAFIALILLIVFVPDLEPQSGNKQKASLSSMIAVSRDNLIKASNLQVCSRAILRQGVTSFLPLYAVKILGMDTMTIGIVLSIYIFIEAISQGFMGPIADRTNKKILLVSGTLIAGILSFFLENMTTALTLTSLLVPIAILTSLSRAAALAYYVDAGRRFNSQGASSGVFNTFQSFGYGVGPILFGFVTDNFGIQSMFLTGGVVGVIVVPFMVIYLLARQPEEPVIESIGAEPSKDTPENHQRRN
jgi:MFS family permease